MKSSVALTAVSQGQMWQGKLWNYTVKSLHGIYLSFNYKAIFEHCDKPQCSTLKAYVVETNNENINEINYGYKFK